MDSGVGDVLIDEIDTVESENFAAMRWGCSIYALVKPC